MATLPNSGIFCARILKCGGSLCRHKIAVRCLTQSFSLQRNSQAVNSLSPNKKNMLATTVTGKSVLSPKLISPAQRLFFSDKATFEPTEITALEYESYSEETLDSLAEFFEDLPEIENCSEDFDCAYGNGVLNIHVGSNNGNYVLNKQAPSKQIWLSSPFSGPKRYDYCDGKWIYVRDGTGLHGLLEDELTEVMGVPVVLKECPFYSR